MVDRAQSWCVVGGGLLGMTLAHRLAQRGRVVTLLEAAPQLGGLAGAWRLGDVTWDRHYHVTLLSDGSLRRLLGELGLESGMEWVQTRTGCYAGDRLHSISDTLEFLRFPELGPVDKLRLGATVLLASRLRDWRRLEQVSVEDWLVRWSGRRVFERFWLPLLRSKLGESWRETSAAFIWATIARLYAARRSGLKREMFGYVPGGYARILERFGEVLAGEGVAIRLGAPVERVEPAPGGRQRIALRDGTECEFDRTVVTLAAPLAARICSGIRDDERTRMEGVRYLGIVCASLLLDEPLAGFYVVNITDEGFPFTGVIEMSSLVDRRKYLAGNHLVYLPRYVAPGDPFFALPDAEVEERFLAGLERMFSAFRRSQVRAFRISRVSHVCAIPTLGYSTRLPRSRTSVPGLHVLGSAHVVNGTLNVNETVQLAEEALEDLLS